MLSACGSDSEGPATGPETPDLPEIPEVVSQGGDCSAKGLISGELADDSCEVGLQSLNSGESVSGFVAQSDQAIYRVPSGAEIMLTNQSGSVDLLLVDDVVPSADAVLCRATSQFIEHNCSATVDNGELYAVVLGRADSTYTLSATTDCSVDAQNEWVYRNMLDYYLYYDRVPTVNPTSYSSAAALVRDLRFNELDPFSNVQDAVRQAEFQESGRSFGFSFRWSRDTEGNARVARVYDDSPFGRAGIRRGDIIIGINGEPWSQLTSFRFVELVGTRDDPKVSTWEFVRGDSGNTEFIDIRNGEHTANTVQHVSSFTNDSFNGRVGYLAFDGFIRTTGPDLDAAIAELSAVGITELVLDLRYNPGGLISVANRLASQIAGPSIEDSRLVRYQYNNKYPDANFDLDAESTSPSLDLSRVIVLTTSRTASASELVINSLRPYLEVITLGSRTVGKAFISAPRRFCGISLNAMEADGVNANGVSVSGGIEADCFAEDDVTRDFGNQSGSIEGMLSASLDYLLNGTCAAAPSFAKSPELSGPSVGNDSFIPGAILESSLLDAASPIAR